MFIQYIWRYRIFNYEYGSGTLLEYTNLKLFIIYHALALKSKRERDFHP